MRLGGITGFAKGYYDRLIAFAGLVLLLSTLVLLGVRVGALRSVQIAFQRQMDRMTPEHAEAMEVDTAPYRQAVKDMAEPFQLPEWSRPAFVPEVRVWCADCRRPIPIKSDVCPFCDFVQPDLTPKVDRDNDEDGMWDEWEMAYGLNPRDPGDARKDADGDGFLNVEEFGATPKTDPTNPNSRPPYEVKLYVKEIRNLPFNLLLQGAQRLPDGSRKFQLNLRDNSRSYFPRLGEEVQGFVLLDYREKSGTVETTGFTMKVDVSVLTIRRGDRTIELTMGKKQSYVETSAVLLFTVDGTEFDVGQGGTFELRGKEYEVISIDSEQEAVVIRRLLDGKEWAIGRIPS